MMFAVAAVFLFTVNGQAAAGPIKIRFSHVVAQNTPKGQAADMFAKLANERLQGKVEVQVFPNSQLYDDNKVLDALSTGSVEMAAPSTAKFTSWVPQLQLFDLPFLFKNRDVLYATMDGEVGQKMFRMLGKKNMLGLTMWDNGFKQIGNSKHEIRTPADVAGLKYRIMSSKVLEAQFKVVGGNPLVMPFSEVYSALEQGVIDGQENTWSNMYSKKMHEVQKYITESDHGYLGYTVVTNAQFWNYLPPDVRTELEAIMKEVTAWIRVNGEKINQEAKASIIAAGTTKVTELSEAEKDAFRAAFKPVHDEFREIIGGDMIDAVYKLNAAK
ncbi:MAG: TRAP transporter substrate-binding protein [Proteobacteria bacterium]|nr:TRAP transporter substrate-binding protein [Pseudomonadota bacterium]MBU1739539.1 TRAP transporter substrate-binding protein [Pseudomonadota bacterium]